MATTATTTGFSARISVPTDHARRLMEELSDAGFVVLDRGDRVTTEEALDGEATLELMRIPEMEDT